MTTDRPDRPISRTEELALAEARDLPPRIDGVDRREPIANRLDVDRELDPRGDR